MRRLSLKTIFGLLSIIIFSSKFANATIGLSCEVLDENISIGFYVDAYVPEGDFYSPRIHTLWFNGNDLITPDLQNPNPKLVIREFGCEIVDTCKIIAKLDINGNKKYEGEFVVKYDAEKSKRNGEDGGSTYTGLYYDHRKKKFNNTLLATCSISN